MIEGAKFCPNCGQPAKSQESAFQDATPFAAEGQYDSGANQEPLSEGQSNQEQYAEPIQYNEQDQNNTQAQDNTQGQYNGSTQYNGSGQYNSQGQNTPGQYNAPGQYNNQGQYNGQNQYNNYGQYQQGQTYNTMTEQKSKVAAGLLQIFLGGFGIGRFYLGYTGIGVAQLLVSIFTCGLGAIWPFIDGILILCGQVPNDANGVPLKD